MDYKSELQSDDDFDCSNSYNDSYSNSGSSNNNNNNSNNINNNNFNSNQPNSNNPNGLSKAELRKTNKPIMEKRRRARINHCLNELKSLILEAMKKDPARHTKLEKADILEMTVKHLQSVQRQQLNMAIQTDPTVIHKFKTGFVECAEEVNRYIGQVEGVDPTVRQRLTSHLSNCANNLEQLGSMTNFNNGYRGQLGNSATGIFGSSFNNALATAGIPNGATIFPVVPQDFNNNSNQGAAIQMGGVQLIPSRLPSGEFALIMPNTGTGSTGTTTTSQFLSNTNSSTTLNPANPFTWPSQQNLNPNQIPLQNEYNQTFQRMSAFSKPSVNTTPPLHQPITKITHYSSLIHNSSHNNNSNHGYPPLSTTNSTNSTTLNTSFNQANTITSPVSNNLHHNTTATNSPPLSPISSVSSHGEDSIMHTSSDFPQSRPTTPPTVEQSQHQQTPQEQHHQHSFSGVFSTPPPSSAESSFSSTTSGRLSLNLQQEQVTSTSGTELNNSTQSLKRSFNEIITDSCDSSDYKPSIKKLAIDVKRNDSGEESDNMWRPW